MRPDRRSQTTDRPFTAVVCHGESCGRSHGEFVISGLRETIRHCRHGILMSTGCLLGPLGCHALARTARPAGALLVVQPCSIDRRPSGAALWVGPLATAEDVTAVCRWLQAGDLRATGLPAALRFHAMIARHSRAN